MKFSSCTPRPPSLYQSYKAQKYISHVSNGLKKLKNEFKVPKVKQKEILQIHGGA